MSGGEDILDLVAGPTLRDRPLSGHMDAISLTASYDFSRAEYENGGPASRATRTVRHETTHAYQTLATSYGYYFQLIKQFQTSRVLHLLAGLDALGEDPAPPLITQIARQRGDRWRQLRIELYAWYLAEVVLIHLEGEQEHWTRVLLENPAFAGRTFPDLYVELEELLVLWLTDLGHRVGVAPGAPCQSSPALDLHLRALTDNGSTAAVLESAAHISEHWRVYPSDLETLARQLPGSTQYSSWIRWALAAGFTDDPAAFCLTFSAVADLALNGALLPHQAGFRRPGYDANSVSPPHRMFLAIGNLGRGNLSPIRDLATEYVPFVQALCDRLEWPLPWEMARFVVPSLPETGQLDPLGEIFRFSQELRLNVPYAFVDLDIWSIDGPLARKFRHAFVHPVIQFSDQVLHHQDQDIPAYAVLNHALGTYLRQLMVVGNQPVRLPLRAGAEELAFYQDLLEHHLAATIGLLDPRITLESAPPSINGVH
jgi:hypothetical protein